jgi:hypothetical protein
MTTPNNDRLTVVVQQSPTIANDQSPKTPSCVVCARRKVRCDRKVPCFACTKHGVECVYPTHVPPRRRKRQRSEESHRHGGFSFQNPSRQGSTGSARISNVDHLATANNAPFSTTSAEQGMLLTDGGKSVYLDRSSYLRMEACIKANGLDSNLWTSVRGEVRKPCTSSHNAL